MAVAIVEQVTRVTLTDLAFDETIAAAAFDADALVGLSGNYLRQPTFEPIARLNLIVDSLVSLISFVLKCLCVE